jgi:hypothetical protein
MPVVPPTCEAFLKSRLRIWKEHWGLRVLAAENGLGATDVRLQELLGKVESYADQVRRAQDRLDEAAGWSAVEEAYVETLRRHWAAPGPSANVKIINKWTHVDEHQTF